MGRLKHETLALLGVMKYLGELRTLGLLGSLESPATCKSLGTLRMRVPGRLGTLHSVTWDTRVTWLTWNPCVTSSGVYGAFVTLWALVSLGPLEHLCHFEQWGPPWNTLWVACGHSRHLEHLETLALNTPHSLGRLGCLCIWITCTLGSQSWDAFRSLGLSTSKPPGGCLPGPSLSFQLASSSDSLRPNRP